MKTARKPRRKADGSYEIAYSCTVCGSQKCEVNSVSGKVHCWQCGSGGRVDPGGYGFFLSSKDGVAAKAAVQTAPLPGTDIEEYWKTTLDLTDKFPVFALQECRRRRQEPQWLIRRYGVRWSYAENRLWFPAGDGGVLRSVLSWEEPKTRCLVGPSGQKGVIGQSLLKPGLDLVLVEGDWKCVSIPVPWTGLGLQGTQLTQSQRFSLLSQPLRSITVMLDNGWDREAQKIVEALLPFPARRVSVPWKGGPDDGPRSGLVKLLLERKTQT